MINDKTNIDKKIVKILNQTNDNRFNAVYIKNIMEHNLFDILADPAIYVIKSNCIGFENWILKSLI